MFVVALLAATGLTPVDPDSPNTERIEDLYWFISFWAALVLLSVAVPLVLFVFRYRSRGRPRTVEGPQVHGSTRLEIAWTVVPVVILLIVTVFTFYKLPGITLDAEAGEETLKVRVEGRQFYWQYRYPNGVIAIDTVRLPVQRPVRMEVTAPINDVIHSWWIPALGPKIDAIPGHPNHIWYEVEKPGSYVGQCAEFCGIQHAAMRATVEGIPAPQFDSWLSNEARAQADGSSNLGEQEFNGVCAKCHGLDGKGGIGPDIATSALIQNKDSLETIVREGRGLMPAVGEDWNQRQMDALFSYLQKRFGSGS